MGALTVVCEAELQRGMWYGTKNPLPSPGRLRSHHVRFSLVSLCSLPVESGLGLSVNLKDFLFSSQFGPADSVVKPTAGL